MVKGFSVDKLEFDAGGKYKLECSTSKDLHKIDGLVVEVKTDLTDMTKLTKGLTYKGLKNAVIKVEARPLAGADMIKDFNAECMYGIGALVIGAKFKGLNIPDVAMNFTSGKIFASTLAKSQFTEFIGHCHYTVSNDIKVAATYQLGGKANGTFTVGGQAKVGEKILAKAKFGSDQSLSFGMKTDIVKGMVLTAGGKHSIEGGKTTYGLKLAVE